MKSRIFNLMILGVLFFTFPVSSTFAVPPSEVNAQQEQPQTPLDVPDILVPDGVYKYDIASPKVFWYGRDSVACIPTGLSALEDEWIFRIPTYGGLTRQLFADTYDPSCNTFDVELREPSNLIADENYIYWMSDSQNALVRLSENANIGDLPEIFSSQVSGTAELAQDTDNVYVLQAGGLRKVSKANGTTTLLTASVGTSPNTPKTDGKYVYWMASGVLKRLNLTNNFITNLASGVTGYHPEGRLLIYCSINPPQCYYSEYVYIGKGDSIDRYNNIDGSNTPIYTSTDPSAYIYNLDSNGSFLGQGHLFFFESRQITTFSYQVYLFRRNRGTGGANDVLYASATGISPRVIDQLKRDGDYLYWQENAGISRLPTDADALPLTNMSITGIEVNQALQNPSNSVRLIKDKRTFVRVYVTSHGDPVSGVTAYLYRTDSGGNQIGNLLTPVNPVGKQITVKSWANRMDINQSFLFELPMSWVSNTPLYLKAVLNPNRIPPESSYGDNTGFYGPFTLSDSPRLGVYFVSFGYSIGNTTYFPHLIDDVFQTYSWIRRAYPLASTPGGFFDPGQGFRPNLWIVYDDGLGSRVDQTAPECNQAPFYYTKNGKLIDDRSLCASAYTNNLLNAMRVENNIPSNIFMYGMIADPPGSLFPRGQASGNVSSGPTGPGDWGWDFDGSYADWYAGHEIGHTLGRAHPDPNSDDPATENITEGCGHSRSDPGYPYSNALISNGAIEGFDVGDPGLNPLLQPAIYPGIFWHDVMSYCDNQWISDYTYEAMYQYMLAHPTTLDAGIIQIEGDFLSIFGVIEPDSGTTTIQHLSRLSSVSEIPPLIDGGYIIRLKDSGGGILADYQFTPKEVNDGQTMYFSFGQVVDFAAGTATVQILDDAETVLASQSISANPPSISNVALQGAPNPVAGTVTLAWTASDPDGDPLTFDIFYSMDGGTSFQPLLMDVSGSSTPVDTSSLAGSNNALFRVVASDGVNTAQGDTAPFVMASKPPQVVIQSPADGASFHYDQLFNLSGMTFDVQDGSVDESNLVWSDQDGVLGFGSFISLSQLPIGDHLITLEATNSKGLSASDSITVHIHDNLDLPGPTLSTAPDRINWHVGEGTTTVQTADLLIDNVGSGSLDWSADEDADWLTLSEISGTVSSLVTISANPVGIEPGTAESAVITITSPPSGNQPEQSVEVIVTLAVGDVWRTFGQVPDNTVYLPVVNR